MINLNQMAPSFEDMVAYQKTGFKKISLKDYHGQWLILFFYPRDFTFVCPTEIKAFAAHEDEFKKLGASILAASTDSEWSHKAWFERDLPEVNYPILADTLHVLSKSYDVHNMEDGSANRGLFIIDPNQKIRYIVMSDGSVGRSVTETLRVLEALQTGELCPAEWKVGEVTLGKS